jgi:GNAT superfamily N-acetyltransferase
MNKTEMLALFDREQRQEAVWADSERTVLPHTVRQIMHNGQRGFVVYSALTETNADEEIMAQLAYFERRGMPFEWKLYLHDRPADLRARLARFGIETDEEEAVMVLDLSARPALLEAAPAMEVRRVTDPAELDLLVAIEEAVWARSYTMMGDVLEETLRKTPDEIAIYLAYADGIPAASAWVNFHPGTHFASIWGGSTLAEFRGRGLYTALLTVRAREAAARGFRFLTVDAGPMSRPILAQHGFETITYSYPCEWQPPEELS